MNDEINIWDLLDTHDITVFINVSLNSIATAMTIRQKFPKAKISVSPYNAKFKDWEFSGGVGIFVNHTASKLSIEEFARKEHAIIIDHEDERIQYYEKSNAEFIDILGEHGISSCVTAWRWLFPDYEVPVALAMIDDYVQWSFENDQSLTFIRGLDIHDTSVFKGQDLWKSLIGDDEKVIESILTEGSQIERYLDTRNDLLNRQLTYRATYKGVKLILANITGVDSLFFKDWLDEDIDLALTYVWNEQKSLWDYRVYSNNEYSVKDFVAEFNGYGNDDFGGFSSNCPIFLEEIQRVHNEDIVYSDFHPDLENTDNYTVVKYRAQERLLNRNSVSDNKYNECKILLVNTPLTGSSCVQKVGKIGTPDALISYQHIGRHFQLTFQDTSGKNCINNIIEKLTEDKAFVKVNKNTILISETNTTFASDILQYLPF